MLNRLHRALIVASGDPVIGPAVDAALKMAQAGALIIAADGGADVALALGLQPHLVIGDLDSIRPTTLESLEAQGASIQRFAADKNETDLELALLAAVERGANWIRVIAATGNRLDQTIANIYLLALPALARLDVRLVAGKQSSWLLVPGTYPLPGAIGDTISLIPFGDNATGISTIGLKYPLHHETLYFGAARGVSNMIIATDAYITFNAGKLLVVHTSGRA
jgi:thiamine pyrophosphokinase